MSSLPFSEWAGLPGSPDLVAPPASVWDPCMPNATDSGFELAALEHLDRLCALGRDAGRLTHDLNNQFTTIRGFCELMIGNLPPDHPLLDFAQEVARSCGRALESLRALPAVPAPQTDADGGAGLIDVLLELIAEAPRHWPLIEASFPPDDLTVRVPAGELGPLLEETLRFVCEHSKPGGRVTITAQSEEGRAKLQFLLTEPAGPWQSVPGKRITLLMLAAALDRMGGSLTSSMVSGGEAALKLVLPASYRKTAAPPATNTAEPGQKTVLVVDDDPQYRSYARHFLASHGYRAVEAADGRIALDCLNRRRYDVVLLDIFMPEPDGFETLRRLRAAHPQVPVVAMSGAAMEYLHTATLLGAAEAISKQELAERLPGVVRKLAAGRAARVG